MEPSPFLPAWQPTPTPSFVFPQSLQGPSSLGLAPSPQHHYHNFLDSRVPSNTSGILAESQASQRLPGLFNGPVGQTVRTAKTVAAAKRKTARSHTQPNMWKAGNTSTYSRKMPPHRQVSQLPEIAQTQPPPVKARERRDARAARSRETKTKFPNQPTTTTPFRGNGEQLASQRASGSSSAGQRTAPQIKVTPMSTHAGPSATAVVSAALWGEHGEGKSTQDCRLVSWATATAAQISQRCALDSLPLDLIEQVLPTLRAHLGQSGHSADAKTCQTTSAQFPASVTSALPQDSWPPSEERSKSLPVAQLPESFHAPPPFEDFVTVPTTVALGTEEFTDDIGWTMTDCSTWAPESQPPTMAQPTLTYAELEALDAAILQEIAGLGLEFLLDIEHSQTVEAGREEYPFAPQTREEIEQSLCSSLLSNTHFSTEPAQGAVMGGSWTGGPDFGGSLDGWEGWDERYCPDNM